MPDHGSIAECDYHGAVEGFAQTVNERLNRNIKEGSTWVRIKPPSKEELEAIREGTPRLMPFVRSGSLAKVESIHYINGVRMTSVGTWRPTRSRPSRELSFEQWTDPNGTLTA